MINPAHADAAKIKAAVVRLFEYNTISARLTLPI
jgi:hypothetical protein